MSSLKRKKFKKLVQSLINAHMSGNPSFLITPTEQQELIIKSACDVAAMIVQHTRIYKKNAKESVRSQPIEIMPFISDDIR